MGVADYRLTPVTEENLQPEQRTVWDVLVDGKRGGKSVRDEGFLVGPFDALLRSPDVALSASRLGEVLRFETELTQRERELAIITVAAHWQASFAWLRHEIYARESGLAADVVDGTEGRSLTRTPLYKGAAPVGPEAKRFIPVCVRDHFAIHGKLRRGDGWGKSTP